jgi:hypothetical protein
VDIEPATILPPPKNVHGKLFSTQSDLNHQSVLTPGQTMFWDGLADLADTVRCSTTYQVNALAQQADALFGAMLDNESSLFLLYG